MKFFPRASRPISPAQAKTRRKWAFWLGFAFFFAVLYVTMLTAEGKHGVFVFFTVELPMMGIILVLYRKTRQFGLGMLLASLVFFATAIASCGAIFE